MHAGTRIPVFRRTRQVAPRDVDLLGHVNNVVWVRFVVELAEAHASALGLGFHATREQGGIWIVRRHDVLYHANVPLGAEVREATWVSSMRGALSHRHARFGGRKALEPGLAADDGERATIDLRRVLFVVVVTGHGPNPPVGG